MNRILRVWRSAFTRRWHTNFDLCDTVDYVAGHQGRCALLALALKPDISRYALIAIVTHDQGEMAAGADMAGDAKRRLPEAAALLALAEAQEVREQGLDRYTLDEGEHVLLHVVDRLDAYLWMLRHARHLHKRPDWRGARDRLIAQAATIDLGGKVAETIETEIMWGGR